MKLVLVINKQLESDLNRMIEESSNSEEKSTDFQYQRQSLRKVINQVYELVSRIIATVGLKTPHPSSVEKIEEEYDNAMSKTLALTVLLRDSNHTLVDRFKHLLAQIVFKESH